jgi:glycosyltransferase involved in cell wall biosynthesis
MGDQHSSLKVVTFTTLYPNSVFHRHGIFVEERLKHLLATGQISATIIAPVPWFPLKSGFFGEYGKLARVPKAESRLGLTVSYPRYLSIPKIGMTLAPLLLALSQIGRFRHLKKTLGGKFIIDAHYLYPDGVAACLLGKWLNLPVVMTARGNDVTLFPKYFLPKKMIQWAAGSCAKLVTVSESLRTQLIDLGVSPDKIITRRNGVDLEKFKPLPKRAPEANLKFSGLKFLSVGHLIDRKSHDLAIKAVAEIPEARLIIIGEGPLRKKLDRLTDTLGVRDRVSFLGNIPQADLPEHYNSADILLLPSKHEGMPNVVLESLGCGTPVVATNAEGVAELLSCPEAGVVVYERTPKAIVAAIRQLSENFPSQAATRAHAESLGWEPTIDGLLEIFRDLA